MTSLLKRQNNLDQWFVTGGVGASRNF